MKNSVYKSECGGYLCQILGGGDAEVWTIDGKIHWADDDRVKTREDARKKMHPLPFCVGGYSAEMTGQKKGSFTLELLQCNVRKFIKPFTGNTIIEKREIVFRRKIPAQNYPQWLKTLLKGGAE